MIQWGTVSVNNSTYTKVPILAMTSYNVFITGEDLTNSIGGKGYLGYVNQLNPTYFYLSMSDIDFDHYTVSVQWMAIGY